ARVHRARHGVFSRARPWRDRAEVPRLGALRRHGVRPDDGSLARVSREPLPHVPGAALSHDVPGAPVPGWIARGGTAAVAASLRARYADEATVRFADV